MKIKEYSLSDHAGAAGVRCYHSVLPPQHRAYTAHHHTECELSVFLAGEGMYTVGERTYPFRAGDVFLFGSNEEHCITDITSPMELLNVQFEPYILWENQDAVELMALFNARKASFENRFSDESGRIKERLLALEAELCEARPCYAVAAKCHLFFALATLMRDYACVDHQKAVRVSDTVTQSVRAAMAYIGQNLGRELTLAEIARVACLSPTYFSSVFKKFNGVSLWKYICIKRVEKAVDMLKHESMTKLEIAERCGFSSASNFYKTFTSVTGKTPGDYIKKQ